MKGFSGNVVGLWLFIGGYWLLAIGQKPKAFPLNSSLSHFFNKLKVIQQFKNICQVQGYHN